MAVTSDEYYLLDCDSYNSYLDRYILVEDLRHVRNLATCRQLVELGYRSCTEMYTPEEFELRKQQVYLVLHPSKKADKLFSLNLNSTDPVIVELARRECGNSIKTISTIIFLKRTRPSGHEVSAYIDYDADLRAANARHPDAFNWAGVFQGDVMLWPKKHHLSYLDWHYGHVYYNESDNYKITHDINEGLIFVHKGDHKEICVNVGSTKYKMNSLRTMIFSERYGHVVFYDHIIKRK